MKTFIPENFTIKHGHFVVECHGGAVDILINSDPATGSENGLIGAVRTKEELMERISEIVSELNDIKDAVYYSDYHDESCWNTLKHRAVEEVA